MSIERLFGLGPAPAPPHVFRVGPEELRYAAFEPGPEGWALVAERSVELPVEIFHTGVLGGPLREPEIFQGLVERLLEGVEIPDAASLILPDTWLRLTFTEIDELPRRRSQRQEVLSWKLKRLVPFRVEELRISATAVEPVPTQEAPQRLMIGFAIETLSSQLERALESAGVHVGRMTNDTLATLAALEHGISPADLVALVAVYGDSYTLTFVRRGEPLLYRYKAMTPTGIGGEVVARELRMTSSFLGEHFPDLAVARVILAAPEEQQAAWSAWLGAELEAEVESLGPEHLELTRIRPGTPWAEVAPLLGAARLEVE